MNNEERKGILKYVENIPIFFIYIRVSYRLQIESNT